MKTKSTWSAIILTNLSSIASGFLSIPLNINNFLTQRDTTITWVDRCPKLDNSCSPQIVDRQSDAKYGRGISHISADLSEGDIIAYQDGTWLVDGSEVGDGSPPIIRFMKVDTIQLVWTHNCEHGVINGFDVNCSTIGAIEVGNHFVVTDDYVQVGPEQVVARIPTVLMEDNISEHEIWLSEAMFNPQDEMTMTSATP